MFLNPFISGNKLAWKASQASFISFINFFEAYHAVTKQDNTAITANEIAELFMKFIKVDISPYPDFETMRMCVQPATPLQETIKSMIAILEDDMRIDDVLENTGVLLSEEDALQCQLSPGAMAWTDRACTGPASSSARAA